MPNPLAIHMREVSKIYQLYGSQRDQLIGVLGLQRIGIRPRSTPKEFAALSDITLSVARGKRIGIIGRNGAGKTTLLKLVCGNFVPTRGTVEVNGTVQALMSAGIGFHPEYTGHENILGALQYNGLSRSAYKEAVDGIVEFCELGDFLDQPVKTYSLGMQARLMFATATAIQPDILIVDEILGAGDAYFVAKSKHRVQKLVGSGCTMLLVSHSMQQVLELCEDVIWLDGGIVRMRGDAFAVVKAYEAHMHGSVQRFAPKASAIGQDGVDRASPISADDSNSCVAGSRSIVLQDPPFRPHSMSATLPPSNDVAEFRFEAPGGLSRWEGSGEIEIVGFDIVGSRGSSNELPVLQPMKFVFDLEVLIGGDFRCRYAFGISDHMGQVLLRFWSPCDTFVAKPTERRRIECLLNPVQLGPGEYVLGVTVMDFVPLEVVNSSRRHDLLSRSFCFKLALPSSLAALDARFVHSAEWMFTAVPCSR